MKINILNVGLAEFFDRKCDIVYGLYHALNDLGHQVTITHNVIERSALNLLVGSDILCGDLDLVKLMTSSGVDYAVYEVENFNGQTINYRERFNLDLYSLLISQSKFTVTPYRYNIKALSEIIDGNKLFYSRWGFHPCMKSNNINRGSSYKYEAVFVGLIKGDRVAKHELIKQNFGNRVAVLTAEDPFTIRDYYMANSKFGLSLSYGLTDNFVNPFRLHYMIANGVPILSDHIHDEDGYLNISRNSTFDEVLRNIESSETDASDLLELCQSNKLAQNLSEVF